MRRWQKAVAGEETVSMSPLVSEAGCFKKGLNGGGTDLLAERLGDQASDLVQRQALCGNKACMITKHAS